MRRAAPALCVMALGLSLSTLAQTYVTIDSGAQETWLGGLNDYGVAVAMAIDPDTIEYFLADSRGGLTPLQIRIQEGEWESEFIWPSGINNRGDIVGLYVGEDLLLHGFLRENRGTVTTIDYPDDDAVETYLIDINNSEQIAGFYGSNDPPFGWYTTHGLLRDRSGIFVECDADHPMEMETVITSINDLSEMTGNYWDGSRAHGFVRDKNGHFSYLSFPSAERTEIFINNRGQIAGSYYMVDVSRDPWFQDPTLEPHSFVLTSEGTFRIIDPHGAVNSIVSGINNTGMIAGTYRNSNGRFLGYIATLR